MRIIKTALCVFLCLTLSFIYVSAQPDNLYKTKQEIEKTNFTVSTAQVKTEKNLKALLQKRISTMLERDISLQGITIQKYTPAGDKNGSFAFSAVLYSGEYRVTANVNSGVILNNGASVVITTESYTCEQNQPLSLTANLTELNGKISWYESNSEDKAGKLLSKTNETVLTVSTSDVGIKYYYCICNNIVSNTVKVEVTKPFVAVSDISADFTNVFCNIPYPLDTAITPSNATAQTVSWQILAGDASLSGGKLTAKNPNEITLQATVKNGGDNREDFVKIFTFIPKIDESYEGKETWEIETPNLDGISSVFITGKYETGVQITALSDITYKKMLETSTKTDNDKIVATAYLMYDHPEIISEISLNLGDKYANNDVTVFYKNTDGTLGTVAGQADESGCISLPAGNSYIVTAPDTAWFDLSVIFIATPLLPILACIIFSKIAKKENDREYF